MASLDGRISTGSMLLGTNGMGVVVKLCTNDRFRPIADIGRVFHHALMTHLRLFALLLILPSLTNCTQAFGVDVSFMDGQPVLTFRTKGMFPRRLDSVCVWNAEIIDDLSGKAVVKLLAQHYQRDCARVSGVTFAKPERGLKLAQGSGVLVSGRSYHAEVIAEDGMGRSNSWRQR